MPKPVDKPNRVGEHQVRKPAESTKANATDEGDDESRTERMSPYREALETSEQLWEQGTRDS